MEEYFNPKSNLTPGALGAFTMLAANTICHVFPEIPFRYAALALSLLMATTTFTYQATEIVTLPRKLVLWVLNALVIFTIGIGSTNIAANVEGDAYASINTIAYAAGGNSTRDGNSTRERRMQMEDWRRKQQQDQMQQQKQFFKRW
jgi:hypothetical protein